MSTYASSFYSPLPESQEAAFFYKQRQHERKAAKPTTSLSVAAIADVDNLAAVYETMKRENGPAPGPDGVRFWHLGRQELYALLRATSEAILAGTYRPGPARDVKIPKSGNRGFRTLTLRNLIDRVVAKAVNEALVPFWETILLDGCHSYRPKRSNWTMLAQVERAIVEQDRWVVVSDDIKNAFPNVNIDLVVDDHKRCLSNNRLLINLIETILRGGDPDRRIGLDQGCPYMPVALNVHLHHVFDVHAHDLGAIPGLSTPWLRYADNLVVACRNVQEGKQVLQQMTQQLEAVGLTLKGENDSQPVNLNHGQSVQLLGFILFKQGQRLCYKLGPGAWSGLRKNLLKAHEANHPDLTARAGIDGWIDSYGPAFRKQQNRTVSYLLQLASDLGFRELLSPDYYLGRCNGAYLRWKRLTNGKDAPVVDGSGDDDRRLRLPQQPRGIDPCEAREDICASSGSLIDNLQPGGQSRSLAPWPDDGSNPAVRGQDAPGRPVGSSV